MTENKLLEYGVLDRSGKFLKNGGGWCVSHFLTLSKNVDSKFDRLDLGQYSELTIGIALGNR